jgi:hypothetical protein
MSSFSKSADIATVHLLSDGTCLQSMYFLAMAAASLGFEKRNGARSSVRMPVLATLVDFGDGRKSLAEGAVGVAEVEFLEQPWRPHIPALKPARQA